MSTATDLDRHKSRRRLTEPQEIIAAVRDYVALLERTSRTGESRSNIVESFTR